MGSEFKIGYLTREDKHPSADYYNSCGLWSMQERKDLWDVYLSIGMAMGILAGYGGLIVFVFHTTKLFCCCKKESSTKSATRVNKIVAGFYCLLATASGLMLLGLQTELCNDFIFHSQGYKGTECERGNDVILSVVSCMLYAGAAFFKLILPKEKTTKGTNDHLSLTQEATKAVEATDTSNIEAIILEQKDFVDTFSEHKTPQNKREITVMSERKKMILCLLILWLFLKGLIVGLVVGLSCDKDDDDDSRSSVSADRIPCSTPLHSFL